MGKRLYIEPGKEPYFTPRKDAPTETTQRGDHLSFVVWAHDPAFQEDTQPWKIIAAFRYLLEALDYIACCCQDRGHDVVFQTPADVKTIKASDRRVVCKIEKGPICDAKTTVAIKHTAETAAATL